LKLEPLYRIRFTYPESWMVGLEGGWEQHLYLAEGRCEGSISGRFRGANYPRRQGAVGPFRPDFRAVIETDDGATINVRVAWVRACVPAWASAGRRCSLPSQRCRSVPPTQRYGLRLCRRGACVGRPDRDGPDLVLDVAELIWEPIAE
jgi:hypothetical protein